MTDMEVKRPNASDGDRSFVRQQKAMQSHNRTTGNYSKHTHAHTQYRQQKTPHMQSLPCQSDCGKQEMKKLNCTCIMAGRLFFFFASLLTRNQRRQSFYTNKPCSSMIKLVDVKTTTAEGLFWMPHCGLFVTSVWITGTLEAGLQPPSCFKEFYD